jgi:hypothetical protein
MFPAKKNVSIVFVHSSSTAKASSDNSDSTDHRRFMSSKPSTDSRLLVPLGIAWRMLDCRCWLLLRVLFRFICKGMVNVPMAPGVQCLYDSAKESVKKESASGLRRPPSSTWEAKRTCLEYAVSYCRGGTL